MSAAEKRTGRSSKEHGSFPKVRLKHKHVDSITDAKKSPLEDWHHRRRLYLVLQVARIPVLVLAVILLWVTNSLGLAAVVAAISVPLPWAAVMLANESGEATKQSEKVYKPAVVRANRAAHAQAQLHKPSAGKLDAGSTGRELDPGTSDSEEAHPVIDEEP